MSANMCIVSIVMLPIELDSSLILLRMEMIVPIFVWNWPINWWYC